MLTREMLWQFVDSPLIDHTPLHIGAVANVYGKAVLFSDQVPFVILHSGESKTSVFVAERLERASIAPASLNTFSSWCRTKKRIGLGLTGRQTQMQQKVQRPLLR
jgi:hypothetical protein